MAYALMLSDALREGISPALIELRASIKSIADQYAELPMLARTHGQAATPTTLGKELNVFATRLKRQLEQLGSYAITVKWNGASGNDNALKAAFPDFDGISFSSGFIGHLCEVAGVTLEQNLVTTQIEPHDTYAELFAILMRINTILIGFCQDIWRYVSDDWLIQKLVEGEVGSSAMPHKVNPIDFENAEGNLNEANDLLVGFMRKLPVSRLQRDLSDSTVERNFGVALAHCLIAYTSIAKGLKKIAANEEKILAALDEHPEVITEAYQTILRSINYPNAYDALKAIARGKKITLEDLHAFVGGLDVPPDIKERMLAITPRNYIGYAAQFARM